MPDDPVTAAALAARAGDPAAAARFVRATQTDVWRLCANLGDPGETQDLAQETYLRAFRALPAFEARSGARTWLLAIARRVCADAVRDRRRRPRLDLTADVPDSPAPVPTSATEWRCGRRWRRWRRTGGTRSC